MRKQIYTHLPTGCRFEVTFSDNPSVKQVVEAFCDKEQFVQYLKFQNQHIVCAYLDKVLDHYYSVKTLTVKGVKICSRTNINLEQRQSPPVAYFLGTFSNNGHEYVASRRISGDYLTLVDIFEALADEGFYVRGDLQIETEPETYEIII
jgi:hypothetical protein